MAALIEQSAFEDRVPECDDAEIVCLLCGGKDGHHRPPDRKRPDEACAVQRAIHLLAAAPSSPARANEPSGIIGLAGTALVPLPREISDALDKAILAAHADGALRSAVPSDESVRLYCAARALIAEALGTWRSAQPSTEPIHPRAVADIRRRLISGAEQFVCMCSEAGKPIVFGYASVGWVRIWEATALREHAERLPRPSGGAP